MLFLRSVALETSASFFPYGGQSLCYQIYICLDLFISVYLFALVDVDMSLNYWDNKHLMTGPEGNSWFCFPRDQSLSDLLCSWTF